MPRLYQLKTNFVAGETDPFLLGRSDIKHYYNGAERLRNAVVLPQGGARSRPGTRWIYSVPDIPEVDGGGQSNVRLCSFQFNTDQTYLIVFTHKKIMVFKNDVFQVEYESPYVSDDLVAQETAGGDLISSGIYWTQSKDTLFIFHENHAPRRFQRQGSDVSWNLSLLALDNIPDYDFGAVYVGDQAGVDEVQEIEFPNPGDQGNWTTGDTFTLLVEDEETENIKWTSNAVNLAARMQSALRALSNTSDEGITVTLEDGAVTSSVSSVFIVTFTGKDGERPWGQIYYRTISAEQIPTIDIIIDERGKYPGEPVWSDAQGWPRCGVFFQGRLWMASTPSLPHWVWASRVGSETDFNSELFNDDYGIAVPADTDDVPAFTACHVGRHLQFFSRSGEYYVPASESGQVSPGNMALRRTTSRGIKSGLRVFDVDGATHFVQLGGAALREFIFTDVEQAYQANNISLLSPQLMRDPKDIALRRSRSTTDADYEFMPNSDGTCTVFCTLRTQEVNAMALWVTKGDYQSVGVVLDEVYFAIKRTIDGEDFIFIEKQDSDLTVDCALTGGAASSATIPHLPNTEIDILLDGQIQRAQLTDENGDVTFERAAASDYVVGLKYAVPDPEYPELIWLIKTLPIEAELPDGAMVGRKRRIVNLSFRLNATTSLIINGNRIPFRQFGSNLLDQPIEPFTGVKTIKGLLGWDYDGQVILGSDQSLPATILALSFGVSI